MLARTKGQTNQTNTNMIYIYIEYKFNTNKTLIYHSQYIELGGAGACQHNENYNMIVFLESK